MTKFNLMLAGIVAVAGTALHYFAHQATKNSGFDLSVQYVSAAVFVIILGGIYVYEKKN